MTRPTRNQVRRPALPCPAGIRADELLPLRAAMERMGWCHRALASAKKRGLRVLTFSKWSYILGADVITFLQDQPTIERKGGPGRPDLLQRNGHDTDPVSEATP